MSNNYIIYWNFNLSDSYSYGSKIEKISKGVYFENPLMPSGTVINSWKSHYNFQDERMTPNLPLLRRNMVYSLEWDIESNPMNSLNIRITFFNQANEVISVEVLRKSKEEFIIPQYTYKYSIELLNAGVNSFIFNNISIVESK